MSPVPSEQIVDLVLKTLDDRNGFDGWWDDLYPDIQAEIKQELNERIAALTAVGATACVCGVAPLCPRTGHPSCLMNDITPEADLRNTIWTILGTPGASAVEMLAGLRGFLMATEPTRAER